MATSSRPYNPGTTERWAKLYTNYDPYDMNYPNNPLFDREEVLWDEVAIADLLNRAFPGMGWFLTRGALSVALALGPNRFGLHEIACKRYNGRNDGFIWARVSLVQHQSRKLKDTSGNPAYEDKVTAGLMKDALKTHGRTNCNRCASYDLKMVRTTLVCQRCKNIVGGF